VADHLHGGQNHSLLDHVHLDHHVQHVVRINLINHTFLINCTLRETALGRLVEGLAEPLLCGLGSFFIPIVFLPRSPLVLEKGPSDLGVHTCHKLLKLGGINSGSVVGAPMYAHLNDGLTVNLLQPLLNLLLLPELVLPPEKRLA
jgi:hypothetical protein